MDRASRQQVALQQLAAIPGVVGTMVFDVAGAVEASSFPAVFDGRALAQLAVQLTADTHFQEWLGGDQGALTMRFLDGQVAVRSLGGSWVLVLCTAQANDQLLSMSLTQLVRRLRATAGAGAPRPALDRLKAVAQAELGEQAAQALEVLSAAGPKTTDLLAAISEVETMVRLFISKKKAEDLARKMRGALDA